MSSALPPESPRPAEHFPTEAAPRATPPERLVRALATAAGARGTGPFLDRDGELHVAICDFVRALKVAGAPPEGVVVAVKAVASRAGLPHFGVPEDTPLIERIVRWCIEEYYRAS
jgi:hypothetical protein